MSIPFLSKSGDIVDKHTVEKLPTYTGYCLIDQGPLGICTYITWFQDGERQWQYICEGFPPNETILHYHG